MKNSGEKLFYILGCIALSPFILKELITKGFQKIRTKIKR